ncbi:guanine nucleotide exchange factor [Aspergillus campestris IBT 28561]|uniref:Guanine nucleotide exchange factor n=1 Tax=Aspergillus campestris (strain IBT 28561) TaxID=1392248 RepID=A0A2I1D167_ASPC2|nr:guanine nucleotide exchange factor [Aspergillus campestris IBT 28561]PKY03615.1 guanine nucleotide exchange factor [Aspergillus campestris IBT 28561]
MAPNPPPNSPHTSLAVDPVAFVISECITVTSAMRKHNRWAHSSVAAILGASGVSARVSNPPSPRYEGAATPDNLPLANRWGLRGKKGKSMQDNPLISAFTRLRADLKDCRDIRAVDAPALLHPFLQVVRSSSTSAAITSLALLLSAAITHCRFEASDSAADEIVLLRILKLMEGVLGRPEGDLLGDESVCEMMETGLSMCCQVRLSEVLRRSAEMAMVNMCQVIFMRLSRLPPAHPAPAGLDPQAASAAVAPFLKMDPSVDGDSVASQHPSAMGADAAVPDRDRSSADGPADPNAAAAAAPAPTTRPHDEPAGAVTPYGLPSIRELFRVLIDLLDPHNRQHTDPMRVMALRILDVALEVAGPAIARHPSLAALAQNDLCRHLFQLVRSENLALLAGSLRVTGTLLLTGRPVLKLQQELYLSYLVACLHPRVDIPREPGIDPALYDGVPQAPSLVKPPPPASPSSTSGRSTPVPVKDRQKLGLEGGARRPETREAMVESIGVLARIPSFMVELFVNYDCDVDRADLCADLVGLLSRSAFPDSATWSTTNVPPLCLDALLGYVQFVYDRLDDAPDPAVTTPAGVPAPDALRDQRRTKQTIIHGAQKFNEDPKAGIAYLAARGVIADPDDPARVAHFLHGTSRVSKKVLGDFLSKRSNEALLDAFVDRFDFAGKTVVDALRDLLGSFRLPGESPLIERIVTTFTDKYMQKAQPTGVADKDALFVLTYGIIMLNTELYNPNIKSQNRMSCADFSRNLRGVNAGQDFAPEFLQEIYDSIRHDEIILPDEHDNQHAFDFAWRELLRKSASAGELAVPGEATNRYDADMFAATWRPVVATLAYVFMSASDDAVYSRVVMGFDQCAQIAARYRLSDAFDRIVDCLATISTLATDVPPSTALNTEVQVDQQKRVMVSELAVKFGRDFRAQLATVVLFRVLAGNESVVRDSWGPVHQILRNLFVNSLIPAWDGNLTAPLALPAIPLQPASQVVDRDGKPTESGLLSAFTSYLSSYAADDPPEPSDEELDNTLCTVDCVTACAIPDVVGHLHSLPLEAVGPLVESLLAMLPEESTPAVIVVKPERPAPTRGGARGPLHDSRTAYDPGMIYLLELATILTLRDRATLEAMGERLLAALQAFIRGARNLHSLALSRVVSYLFNLLRLSHDQSFMRVPVILHNISGFDQDILESVAVPIVQGLTRCIANPEPLRNEITISPDFWSILQRLHQHKEAASLVFELLQLIVDAAPAIVTADNYESAVALANDFISAGSVGSVDERQNDAMPRRKGAKQAKSKDNEIVSRGLKAIGLIYRLTGRVPALIQQSHLEKNEAWSAYWSPVLHTLTSQCTNPCRDIRHHAVSTLQRSLLSIEISSTDDKEWTAIFDQVLFPLVLRLLKPEVYHSDPVGMSETRVQAATLVCKIFLRYLDQHPNRAGMLDLWLKILDILDRMMNSGQGDSLEEAIPESLKNVLLVMADGGYLVPPSQDPSKEQMWTETKKRLERFLPDLFQEIFAQAPKDLPLPASRIPSPAPSPAPEASASALASEEPSSKEGAPAEEAQTSEPQQQQEEQQQQQEQESTEGEKESENQPTN